jgi:hypothetical protein
MSPLHDALADYLKIRRALGYKLERAGKLLPQYLDYLDDRGDRLVTIENARAWADRDTLKLLLAFAATRRRCQPCKLDIGDLNTSRTSSGCSRSRQNDQTA